MADPYTALEATTSKARGKASTSDGSKVVFDFSTASQHYEGLNHEEADATPELYNPLDTNKPEIRLFEIHPASNPKAQVKVTLSTHDLPTAVRDGFIPLSYVWGKPTPTNTIRVNDRPVQIRQNPATFLKHIRDVTLIQLRSEHGCGERIFFWADALCVDQSSVDERNHQVGLMKRIYGGANICLGWIGEFEDEYLAVELIDAIYHEWRPPHSGHASDDPLPESALGRGSDCWMASYPKFWERNDDGLFLNRHWNAIASLFATPYWGPVWTLQEHVLPKNFLLVLQHSLIPLPKANGPHDWLKALESSPNSSLVNPSVASRLLSLYEVFPAALARLRAFTDRRADIASVCLGVALNASDPRDHVFGMLGLVNTQLVADYDKSTKEVWISLCLTWWLECDNLSFLRFAGVGHRSTSLHFDLPSWAADWAYLGAAKDRLLPLETRELPDRLRSVKVCCSLSEDTLCVPGILADEVATVSPRLPNDLREIYSTLFDIAQAFILDNGGVTTQDGKHIVQALALITLDNQPREKAKHSIFEEMDISSTNITDLHTLAIQFIVPLALGRSKSEDLATGCREALRNMRQLGLVVGKDPGGKFEQHISENADGTPLSYDEILWASLLHEIQSSERTVVELAYTILSKLANSVLFITKTGCIGLAQHVKMGDHVAIVAKYEFVVVLRSKGNDFELVESCEIQGMDHKRIDSMEVEELRLV